MKSNCHFVALKNLSLLNANLARFFFSFPTIFFAQSFTITEKSGQDLFIQKGIPFTQLIKITY
jgi:hypothetical protein